MDFGIAKNLSLSITRLSLCALDGALTGFDNIIFVFLVRMARGWPPTAVKLFPATRIWIISGPLGVLLSPPALDVRLMTALQASAPSA